MCKKHFGNFKKDLKNQFSDDYSEDTDVLIPTICYLIGLVLGLIGLGILRAKGDYSSYSLNYGELFCFFWPIVLPGYIALKAFEGIISFGETIAGSKFIKNVFLPSRN